MLSSIKNTLFWVLDNLRGGKVRKAYRRIEKYYQIDSASSEMENYYSEALQELLKQATENTNYYKSFKGRADLSSYPVVNKNIITNREKDFLSKNYTKSNLIKMSTSGSTGTPFTSYQNINKKRCVNAETIFFNSKAGYKVGSKLAFLRSTNNKSKKSKFKQMIQSQKIIDVDKLDDNKIKDILYQINVYTRNESATLLSYASTYDILRDYFKRNVDKEEYNIHGIISTSEILYEDTRKYISDTFKCSCYSRYANMENGMLGQDNPEHPNTFILNEGNYYIEILKMGSDDQADFGESGRIVVTDLYNYAMPMIRYDTGDVGAFVYINSNGVKKKAITNFGGRKIDIIYDIYGNVVSPHKVSVVFWNYSELKQFQFIQEGKNKYKVLLNIKDHFERENELKETLKFILGKEANININIVDNIPPLPSGKRKYIMNKTL